MRAVLIEVTNLQSFLKGQKHKICVEASVPTSDHKKIQTNLNSSALLRSQAGTYPFAIKISAFCSQNSSNLCEKDLI